MCNRPCSTFLSSSQSVSLSSKHTCCCNFGHGDASNALHTFSSAELIGAQSKENKLNPGTAHSIIFLQSAAKHRAKRHSADLRMWTAILLKLLLRHEGKRIRRERKKARHISCLFFLPQLVY